eukprot:CAMPEP_0170527336 /NCGR_PEP_ID=MMETSP0209-20121228/12835_1 /TAXON_ID=665100 ORGANISM="Litonotus pictus, Strain P1" /NCGR_SAMPLE_ID=MMETSP0209 /ASSEMBLY_ACC=CAM_ASM_000301 /LENGTH=142 /DNA_ID=CAMNT_0010817817 /DNA_START=780 /DNA_END=1205 /DNA_ORIENTATION=-
MKQFDKNLTCKIFGYKTLTEYFRKTESGPDLDKLKGIKTLILVAKDDPIVCLLDEDYIKIRESENIILVRTDFGGHIGWFEGLNVERWFVNKCVSFCDSMIQIKSNNEIMNPNQSSSASRGNQMVSEFQEEITSTPLLKEGR